MSVEDRLGDLRRLVDEGRAMPMSASVMVNRHDLLQRLDDLERAVREALAEADQVTAARDAVVDEGRREAESLVAQAREEQLRMASATEVAREAQERADDELARARTEAAALREETDAYVDHQLAGFEVALERTLDTVRRGRQRLAVRDAPGTTDADRSSDPPSAPGAADEEDEGAGGFW
jgi:cell division septum initiation protein DivIVA